MVFNALGVAPQTGGEHVRMGTHNLLLRLGDASYLEVIAIDPAAPAPGRPRWFALDKLGVDAPATLATWVARTDALATLQAQASEALGTMEPMSRGALDWHITVPSDGSLPLGGVAPTLIQWQTPDHPASRLVDHGLTLVKLELFHPEPDRVERLLKSLSVEAPVTVACLPPGSSARLVAHIQTPNGLRIL